jgi:hypothetical protein
VGPKIEIQLPSNCSDPTIYRELLSMEANLKFGIEASGINYNDVTKTLSFIIPKK